MFWHTFFQYLYFVPIVVVAILFGWRGGLGAATLSGLCHASSLAFTGTRDIYVTEFDKIRLSELFQVAAEFGSILVPAGGRA